MPLAWWGLLLADRHIIDLLLGIDVKAVSAADRLYLVGDLLVRAGFALVHAQRDVLDRGKDVDQLEVLVDHADA